MAEAETETSHLRLHVGLRHHQRDVVETTLLCLVFKMTDIGLLH